MLDKNVKVVFDPNIRLKMWSEEKARKVILSILPFVDYLLVGENELEILLGHKELNIAIKELEKFGCKNIVIKLGESGALYKLNGVKGSVSNPQTFVEVDPVGAGDAFAAGIVSGILKGYQPSVLVEKACFLGGYITQFYGDYQGFPSEQFVDMSLNNPSKEKVNR